MNCADACVYVYIYIYEHFFCNLVRVIVFLLVGGLAVLFSDSPLPRDGREETHNSEECADHEHRPHHWES